MPAPDNHWLSTSAAEAHLNISRKSLYKKKDLDRLRLGVHYRVLDPHADRLTYQWNVQAIEKTMETEVEELLAINKD